MDVVFLLRRLRRWTSLDARSGVLGLRERIAFGRRFPRRGRGFWYSLAIDVIWPMLVVFTKLRVRGLEHLPREGGVLVASNHLSFGDPVTVTAFCLGGGRIPRYLAKADLWNAPLIRSVMRSGGHIPVHRGAPTAREAYRDAVAALGAGECVAIFPESTFSDDPDYWPMHGKTGVARIALATGTPVIPLANWGTHDVLPPSSRLPRLLPRKTINLVAGPPVDLSDLADRSTSAQALREATDRIMAAITELLEEVRGERRHSS
jgi:1-acyl-sn-glycerol-3-phosphate acyltransferase